MLGEGEPASGGVLRPAAVHCAGALDASSPSPSIGRGGQGVRASRDFIRVQQQGGNMDNNPRLKAITERLVEHVLATIVEFEVGEDELMRALAYLTEVGRQGQFILLSDVL